LSPDGKGNYRLTSVDKNKDIDIKRALNEHIFKDKNAIAGKLVYDLGNTYLVPQTEIHNASIIAKLLYEPDIDLTKNIYSSLNKENLLNTIDYIENVMAPLDKAHIKTDDADQIKSELICASKILKHGCRLGIARLETPNKIIQEIPHSKKQILARELKQIIPEFKMLWLVRNRPGGLEDSLNAFSRLLDYYEKQD
jgi:hexosaminidase